MKATPENLQKHTWFGFLTIENCENVANEIKRRLEGKYYTYVSDHPHRQNIEVVTHRKLIPHDNGELLIVKHSEDESNFSFYHPGTYWFWYTRLHDSENVIGERSKLAPYISFEGGTIRISQEIFDSKLLRVVLAVEEE